MRTMLRSKIHRAHVTDSNVNYEGSIAIDRKLLEAADILPYEQVDVVNVTTALDSPRMPSKESRVRFASMAQLARLAVKGDIVIILCYHQVPDEEARRSSPRLIYVDAANSIVEMKRGIG